MIIRHITPEDSLYLKRFHAEQSAKYDFPQEQMFAGRVVVDEEDVPRIALTARRTAELYAVFDHEYETPAWRMEALKMLIKELRTDLLSSGYTDAYCFVASDVPKSYVRRLMQLGARKMVVTCLHFLKGEI